MISAFGGGIGAVVLFVEDLARSKDFYVGALEMPVAFEDEASVIVNLSATMVVLLQRESASELLDGGAVGDGRPPAFQLSVFVDDVNAAHSSLVAKGVPFFIEPVDRAWGKRTAHFKDPDGHVWELAQDIPA